MNRLRTVFLVLCFLLGGNGYASDFISWHSTNMQLLQGNDDTLGDNDTRIVTFEHANAWRYWHNTFCVDGVTESVPQEQLNWVL